MLPHDLAREWLALPSPTREELHALGVTHRAMHLAGGLAKAAVEVMGSLWTPAPDGMMAVVVPAWTGPAPSICRPVENPALIDEVAFAPGAPDRWWFRTGAARALGEEQLEIAHVEGLPIVLFDTPLDWLQRECRGAVLF